MIVASPGCVVGAYQALLQLLLVSLDVFGQLCLRRKRPSAVLLDVAFVSLLQNGQQLVESFLLKRKLLELLLPNGKKDFEIVMNFSSKKEMKVNCIKLSFDSPLFVWNIILTGIW